MMKRRGRREHVRGKSRIRRGGNHMMWRGGKRADGKMGEA
jgi:hypothetical protein